MKRPHRRMHLLIWLLLAPATALLSAFFWIHREQAPLAEIPDFIQTGESR